MIGVAEMAAAVCAGRDQSDSIRRNVVVGLHDQGGYVNDDQLDAETVGRLCVQFVMPLVDMLNTDNVIISMIERVYICRESQSVANECSRLSINEIYPPTSR